MQRGNIVLYLVRMLLLCIYLLLLFILTPLPASVVVATAVTVLQHRMWPVRESWFVYCVALFLISFDRRYLYIFIYLIEEMHHSNMAAVCVCEPAKQQ